MSDEVSLLDNPKVKSTLLKIRTALESGPSAGIAQIARLIQELTSRIDTISVEHLAELISGDVDLMARVLSAANTLGYNPSATSVTTVHQAIHLVGFEKIRNLAVALLLLDTAEKRNPNPQRQKVAATAFGSGLIAQAVLESQGIGEPEEAFVCAALRSYGELLLVHCIPEEFESAVVRGREVGFTMACREAFGLTPLEIGREILAQSAIPKSLLAALQPVSKSVAASKHPALSDRLAVTAEFATRLSAQLADGTSDGTVLEIATKLSEDYPSIIKLDEETWEAMFQKVSARVQSFANVQGLKLFSSPVILRLKKGPKSTHSKLTAPATGDTTRMTAKIAGAQGDIQSSLDQLFAGLESGVDGKKPSFSEGVSRILGWLQQQLKLSQTVVFFPDTVLPTWSARLGNGAIFNHIRNQPLLSVDSKNVFTICLTRGEDVLIEHPDDRSIRRYMPEWLLPHLESRPLLLISLRSGNETLAVICGVGEAESSISRTNQLAKPLQEVKNRLLRLGAVAP